MQQEELLNTADDRDLTALGGHLLLNYALNEQRRMRSRKLHYLDHPEFGMLILITPYEAQQAEPLEVQDVDAPAAVTKAVN